MKVKSKNPTRGDLVEMTGGWIVGVSRNEMMITSRVWVERRGNVRSLICSGNPTVRRLWESFRSL